MVFLLLVLLLNLNANYSIANERGVRTVSKTSCDVTPINLGLGITTQIVFEQEPKVTLYADKKHFKINTNQLSPRSLAIIPLIKNTELDVFKNANGKLPSQNHLVKILNKSFMTNLFVFFENNNQLMFKLQFVEKDKADYIVKIKQAFKKDCVL